MQTALIIAILACAIGVHSQCAWSECVPTSPIYVGWSRTIAQFIEISYCMRTCNRLKISSTFIAAKIKASCANLQGSDGKYGVDVIPCAFETLAHDGVMDEYNARNSNISLELIAKCASDSDAFANDECALSRKRAPISISEARAVCRTGEIIERARCAREVLKKSLIIAPAAAPALMLSDVDRIDGIFWSATVANDIAILAETRIVDDIFEISAWIPDGIDHIARDDKVHKCQFAVNASDLMDNVNPNSIFSEMFAIDVTPQ